MTHAETKNNADSCSICELPVTSSPSAASGRALQLLAPKSCLVLGGGFLGTSLANALSREVAHVHVYGRNTLTMRSLQPQVQFTQGELDDRSSLSKAMSEAEIIFHLAGSASPASANADPLGDVTVSLVPTLVLLELSKQLPSRRIVFVSSGGTVYGSPKATPIDETSPTNPTSIYAIHKLAIERYLAHYHEHHGLEYITLRVSNPYGPLQVPRNNQGVVAAHIRNALARRPLQIWGTGSVIRDFIYVNDVVDALLSAAVYTGPQRLFNVGSGVGRSISSIVDDIEHVLGTKIERQYMPARAVDVPINVLDIRRIRKEFGWEPVVPWLDGLRATIDWITRDSHS